MPEPTTQSQGTLVYRGRWIIVNRLLQGRGRRTHLYEVLAREHGTRLGLIAWDRLWGCYVLRPKDSTLWSENYLQEICAFLRQQQQGEETIL